MKLKADVLSNAGISGQWFVRGHDGYVKELLSRRCLEGLPSNAVVDLVNNGVCQLVLPVERVRGSNIYKDKVIGEWSYQLNAEWLEELHAPMAEPVLWDGESPLERGLLVKYDEADHFYLCDALGTDKSVLQTAGKDPIELRLVPKSDLTSLMSEKQLRHARVVNIMRKWGHEEFDTEGLVYITVDQMLEEGYRK